MIILVYISRVTLITIINMLMFIFNTFLIPLFLIYHLLGKASDDFAKFAALLVCIFDVEKRNFK